MIKLVMVENIKKDEFEIPSNLLDEVKQNITDIIESFDIPNSNKTEVLKKINFMYKQTRKMSLTDILTGLFNRRYFEDFFEREYNRAKRYNSHLSLAIIDIDLFKTFNDSYGHLCGDYVLKELSYLLKQNFRQSDVICRYGGEEFVVILTETSLNDAFIPLERLRKLIENHKFNYKKQSFTVTISVGISDNTDLFSSPDMFEIADKALYDAKNKGRNIVCLANKT